MAPRDRPAASSSTPEVTLVVPCYNEASRIRAEDFLTFARGSGGRARLLFVDDGSVDDTLAILEDIRSKCPEGVSVLALPRNVGKAEAVRVGMLAGCDDGSSFVGFWDADLATPLDHVAMFRDVFDDHPEVDMVFGARVGLLGRRIRRSMRRHYLGRVFATLASTALGMGVYDTQCGAKLFRVDRHGELRAVLGAPFETRWVFDCEMIGRYAALRRWGRVGRGDGRTAPKLDPGSSGDASASVASSVYEYPLHRWEDVAGSKVRMSDVVKMAWGLVMIRRRYFGSTPWPPFEG